MSDERFRRDLNQVFDDVAGPPSSNLPDRVRRAITTTPESRGQYWVAGVAAAVIATLIVGVLVVAGPLKRSPSPAGGVVNASPTPSESPSPSLNQGQLPAFTCVAQDVAVISTPPAPTPPVAFISALRTGTHSGYDRLTIEFANGVPQGVQVSAPRSDTTFTMSPSGLQATVKGERSIEITIHGSDLHTSYTGSTDVVTGDPTIAEVRRVQDFEGVVQIGLGVNGSGCYRVMWMTGPDRLVIDVQTAG